MRKPLLPKAEREIRNQRMREDFAAGRSIDWLAFQNDLTPATVMLIVQPRDLREYKPRPGRLLQNRRIRLYD